jgi:sterol desaturase/sphingolipid hydroxylase (fatty acid hydroxylase superfamily)
MMFVPYGIMSWIGFRPSVVETARAIDLTYQFWLHTELIDRLGIAEEFLNTPSHHRVHHGSQAEYLDRNHGGILIIWDRLFGTFQREGQRVRFGLAGTQGTTNPVQIMTNGYRSIFRDVAKSRTWRERIRLVFGRPVSPKTAAPHSTTKLKLAS